MVEQESRSKELILETFDTAEINPQQIGDFLGVRLAEEFDIESTSRIYLHYGQVDPVLVIRFNSDKRNIIVGVYATYGPESTYRFTAVYKNVNFLRFVRYQSRGSVRSDIGIMCRGQDGMINRDGIISDTDHQSS